MRYIPTILLTIVTITLVTLAVVQTDERFSNRIFGIPPKAEGEILFDIPVRQLAQTIEVRLPDGTTGVFERTERGFIAKTPWNDRVSTKFIDGLFAFTQGATIVDTFERDEEKLPSYGLGEKATFVLFKDADGNDMMSYNLGRKTAWHIYDEENEKNIPTIFLRPTDDRLKNNVYLVTDPVENVGLLFRDQLKGFRDHRPFFFHPGYLDSLRISQNGRDILLTKEQVDGKDIWQISKPLNLRIDDKALTKLFSNLGRLTAFDVRNQDAVTLPEDNARSNVLEIAYQFSPINGETIPETVMRAYLPKETNAQTALATVSDRNAVFTLPLTSTIDPDVVTLSQLQVNVNDLRAKNMCDLKARDLQTIAIQPVDQPAVLLTLDRKSPKQPQWRLLDFQNQLQPINLKTLEELIAAVVVDPVEKFATDAATDLTRYGLDNPFLRLSFINRDQSVVGIEFGRIIEGESPETRRQFYFGRIANTPNIWQVSHESMSKIAPYPWNWRPLDVWFIPQIDVKGIYIERDDKPTVALSYDYFREAWGAEIGETDASAELNHNRANRLLSNLSELKTPRWLGPFHRGAREALMTPFLRVQIVIENEDDDGNPLTPITQILSVARASDSPANRVYYGKITSDADGTLVDDPDYFLIPHKNIQQLTTELFEK
ncbi:DUF4340 domain-containing protein [Persicirhabdus sediminis]|uniref:DUF4340 domain-containing protein n=1 Tax=Persicirhabdus sediminis TaxID=454144 RepID=A0A8J7MDM9_9BACT|nr:DUF4340 domain-containing protein [Persicirhabdus sediminis]MBK1791082.1 DUF4340 domain-containing protein [Persicirhabdus sediminis]